MKDKNVEDFVRSVDEGKNVKANKQLEKILQEKVAKRIKEVLKN